MFFKRSKRQAQSLHGGNPSPASHCPWSEAHTLAHHPQGRGYTFRPLHISSPPTPSLGSLQSHQAHSSLRASALAWGCPGAGQPNVHKARPAFHSQVNSHIASSKRPFLSTQSVSPHPIPSSFSFITQVVSPTPHGAYKYLKSPW